MMHGGDYGWGMGFGWIWMTVFWGLVIAAIVYFARTITRNTGKSEGTEMPLDILKRRFAKGEISKEEFERMRDELLKS